MKIHVMQHFLQDFHIPSPALDGGKGSRPAGSQGVKQREDMALNHQFKAVSFFLRYLIQRFQDVHARRIPGIFPMECIAGKALVPHEREQIFFHDKAVGCRLQKLRRKDEIIHDTVSAVYGNNAVKHIGIDEKAVPFL